MPRRGNRRRLYINSLNATERYCVMKWMEWIRSSSLQQRGYVYDINNNLGIAARIIPYFEEVFVLPSSDRLGRIFFRQPINSQLIQKADSQLSRVLKGS
jgi:hypothetical protein